MSQNTTFTHDGIEVPGDATLAVLGFTRDEYVARQRKMIADGVLHPASSATQLATLSRERAVVEANAPRVVLHGGRTITVPGRDTLAVLGMTADEYIATEKKMLDDGVL